MVDVSERITIISAVGVDREGRKHILGLEAGATENAAAGSKRRRH
jgi:transposase-like protein